jgi:M6 family metalloprotease-like protein
MKRAASTIIILLGLLSTQFSTIAVAANPQTGGSCSKVGKIQTYLGFRYTCLKSGKKLIWGAGIAVAAAKPQSPTASSSNSNAQIVKVSANSDYRPIEDCKLINKSGNNDVNVSNSPRAWKLIDPSKPIRFLIFPVDFPDLVSNDQNSPDFKKLISDFEAFYSAQSNSNLKFTWTISPKFKRMGATIASYGVGARAAGSVWKLNYDIQDLAFKTYSKNDFDFIIGSAPTTTTRDQIASSPAFGSPDPNYLGATYLGGDYWSNGSSWTIPAHEFGHFGLGIADLYDFQASMLQEAGFKQQFQHLGVYDIMNWAGGAGLEMTAWSRWIAHLISDTQMRCLPATTSTTLLKPIEDLNNDVKGLVLPISESQAIVIENRTAKGFDKSLPEGAQGVIVYFIDTSIQSGYGPSKIVRKSGSQDIWFQDNALKVGQSLNYLGYSIKVVGNSGDQLYVEVKKAV